MVLPPPGPVPYCLPPLTPPSVWSLLSLSRVQRSLLSVYSHKCVVFQIVGCPPYDITGSWDRSQVTTCVFQTTQFPALVLYCIVLCSLYNRVLLSILYCIVFSVTLHSHANYNKGTITNKQTNILYSHYCPVLYC